MLPNPGARGLSVFPALSTDTQLLPSPLAATGTTTIRREVVGDEYVTALQDVQQRMRVYTRMRRGDGAVNTSLLAIEKPILGARWDVAGDDEIAEACRRIVRLAERLAT